MSLTENALLGGRVRLRQPKDGYRAGMDAVLLAAACDADPGQRVLDAGCGAGAVMLAAASRLTETRFTGLERDPQTVDLARDNIALNGLGARADVVEGVVGSVLARLGLAPFDAVLANPPFFDDPAALRPPAPAKRGAWMSSEGLDAWTQFLLSATREGGTITLIHRADRLADILAGLSRKAGSFQIRPVAPFADTPAKRVVVRSVKTGKAPLKLLPPLVLHDRESATKHTAAAEAILRGEATLPWT
jgi:tRNA1(Val) A37 N6-methylase TrmN6